MIDTKEFEQIKSDQKIVSVRTCSGDEIKGNIQEVFVSSIEMSFKRGVTAYIRKIIAVESIESIEVHGQPREKTAL